MKFVCDRCNTRYSIGDDRVRGKILKIRCKSCANVITVREGMPNPDADPEPAGPQGHRRLQKTTTAAPVIQSEALAPDAAPGGALGAAFASAMAKPPPALHEEWYVSIDGDQAGPLSLGEAQRWVAAQPFDAELHCWSEGFDDWLPVDKVSHFRGLRKPAPPVATPPPLSRPAPGGLPGAMPRSEPAGAGKPLFAATMAQLEKGPATPELRGRGMAGPAAGAPAPPPLDLRGIGARPSATPPNGQPGMPAHGSGAAGLPSPTGAPLQARVSTRPDLIKAPLKAFDSSELVDSSTQMDALSPDAGADAAVTAPAEPGGGDGGDDLDIGEVSRVVKLADLARDAGRHKPGGTQPPAVVGSRTGSVARLDGPRLGELGPGSFGNRTGEVAALFPEPSAATPPVAVSHRRALIALIAGAAVLVGVAVGVVFFVLSDHESSGSRLGTVEAIDTTRPEEVRPTGSGAGATVAVTPGNPETPANPLVPKPRKPAITSPVPPPQTPEVPPAGGTRLEAREIEEMAGKNASTTQRCYMRAQRGADGILLGDVKKISVTLTISGDGQVTDAQLSDNHAQNTLGKCLVAAIKSWKFRASPGGTFRFVLHFG